VPLVAGQGDGAATDRAADVVTSVGADEEDRLAGPEVGEGGQDRVAVADGQFGER
jgi:hypothetical protein